MSPKASTLPVEFALRVAVITVLVEDADATVIELIKGAAPPLMIMTVPMAADAVVPSL
jgi:hypothetical protein